MAPCLVEPPLIAIAKSFGSTLGILGAVVAWLVNNLVQWVVWLVSQYRAEYDLVKGLQAEIASNQESEENYANPQGAPALIARLRTDPGPYKPWVPYVSVIEKNTVFDNAGEKLFLLPAGAIGAIVRYYNLTTGLTRQLADLRSDAFRNLSHARQASVITQIFGLGPPVVEASQAAMAALGRRLNALRVLYGVSLAATALLLLVGTPTLIGQIGRLASAYVTPAVEWASTCDLSTPKSSSTR